MIYFNFIVYKWDNKNQRYLKVNVFSIANKIKTSIKLKKIIKNPFGQDYFIPYWVKLISQGGECLGR